MNRWRVATARPVTYWLCSALLIWLTLAAGLADILLAPQWFAPHWQCDSLGIPIMQTKTVALPYAVFALLIAGILTWAACWKRVGGRDIFLLRGQGTLPAWLVGGLALPLIAMLVFDIGRYLYEVAIPRTIIADCNVRADPITVTHRRPLLQTVPIIEALLILWMLHLRAYALSPKKVWAATDKD